MSRTSYLTTHHGSFWFQIRVPVAHQPRHGLRVRTNLQTNDPAVAKTLALRLAAEWLVRFSHEPEAPLNVLEHDLGWMLNIEDGEGQRVKTSSSRRLVPLHSDVIAAGFSRFVQDQRSSGHEWLFSDLEPDHDGRRGGNFGKFFARFLRQNQWCGITDRRLVFHSFRHTFKTLCREHGVAEEVHDALTGHVGSTVGRSYGMVPIERLVAAVGSLKLPVDLPRVV